jgi:(p)ppGpp synthase/HD superfamily hydrolase
MAKAAITPPRRLATALKSVAKKAAPKRPATRARTPVAPARAATIEDAVELAVTSHRGQVDKYRQPYILHVIGVAGRCRSIDEKIVAFLHDVVEDTDTTLDDLRHLGFSEPVVVAVGCLTRRKGETYDAFVDRIAPNPLARAVKLADLEDNMDIRRSNRPMKEKDAERMEKYRKAWQRLADLHAHGGE